MRFEWDQNDRYLSNDGKGPLTARILCVTQDTVKLERWNKSRIRGHVRFELPLKFFVSPRCGWKRIEH
jgi:hypothetical protein